MAKVSVIVPVYNVEAYIHKCVDSILNQTMRELEVILVDDGAQDKSGAICDEYAGKDDRVQVIHKENGGLSDARNAGVMQATGDYILFVDSDDYIRNDMIECLYHLATHYGVDMSVCGVYNVYANGAKAQCDVIEEFLCDNIEAFGHILVGQKIPGTICNKLIKRDIAKQLLFPVGRLYEDAFYTTQLMQKVQSVYVTTEPMYYYFHRSGSITTKPFGPKDMDVIAAYEQNLEVVKKRFPKLVKQAKFRLDWAYFTVLDRMLQLDNYKETKDYLPVVKYLRKNTWSVLTDKYFYKSRKIGALALLFSVKMYRFLVHYNAKKNAQIS